MKITKYSSTLKTLLVDTLMTEVKLVIVEKRGEFDSRKQSMLVEHFGTSAPHEI